MYDIFVTGVWSRVKIHSNVDSDINEHYNSSLDSPLDDVDRSGNSGLAIFPTKNALSTAERWNTRAETPEVVVSLTGNVFFSGWQGTRSLESEEVKSLRSGATHRWIYWRHCRRWPRAACLRILYDCFAFPGMPPPRYSPLSLSLSLSLLIEKFHVLLGLRYINKFNREGGNFSRIDFYLKHKVEKELIIVELSIVVDSGTKGIRLTKVILV